jgi:hypothetical protein
MPKSRQIEPEKAGEPKCMTPGDCVLPHGLFRAYCGKCQAIKSKTAPERAG